MIIKARRFWQNPKTKVHESPKQSPLGFPLTGFRVWGLGSKPPWALRVASAEFKV